MRVLMTADTVGGVWTYALDLVRGLGERGVEVALASMGAPPDADQRRAAAEAGVAALHASGFALEWMDDPWEDVDAAGQWLLELAHAEPFDVVHSNSYAHGALGWPCPVVVAGHSCVCSWWRAVEGCEAPPEWERYRARVTRGLAAADAVVAPSAAMLRELEHDYGVRDGIVIANGSGAPEACAAKAELVLTSGRLWDRAKGLGLLDGAARGLDWPVLAAGDGGPARNLRVLGRLTQDELTELRQRAAIYAAPARYEPFGLGILEAARAACALVLGDIPSLRELWDGAALFVDTRGAGELRAALERLIADPDERARLGQAARMRSREFSVERMASAYVELYERVAVAQEAVA